MNKKEIDEMMLDLPSQRPQETTGQKWAIGSAFVMFIILCVFAPDIRYQPTEENINGNCQKDTSQENTGKEGGHQGTSEESPREGRQTPRGAIQT